MVLTLRADGKIHKNQLVRNFSYLQPDLGTLEHPVEH
jgi:hypothetical protein